MSLIFTLLCATNEVKPLTLVETFDFHINLVGWKGTEFDLLDKVRKKDFTENKPKEDSVYARASGTDVDKCTWAREVIVLSRSLISKSVDCDEKLDSKKKRRQCHR